MRRSVNTSVNTQIVWFKRDLRLHDHAAFSAAAARGPVLPLYLIEPDLWRQPDSSSHQWKFIRDSLAELDESLVTRWMWSYNHQRPNMALGGITPKQRLAMAG